MKSNTFRRISATMIATLFAMQTLTVHAEAYTAKGDDTLFSIAKAHNISLSSVIEANPQLDPLNIYPGLKVELPESVQEKAAVNQQAAPKAQSNNEKAKILSASPDDKVIEVSGQAKNFKKKLSVKATAYTSAASENGKWGAVDYFGNKLTMGTIAVDPDIIPLGTKVYVTGYTFDGLPIDGFVGKATDMGGAINGNRIDIFVPTSPSKASNFGIQNVSVYILE